MDREPRVAPRGQGILREELHPDRRSGKNLRRRSRPAGHGDPAVTTGVETYNRFMIRCLFLFLIASTAFVSAQNPDCQFSNRRGCTTTPLEEKMEHDRA